MLGLSLASRRVVDSIFCSSSKVLLYLMYTILHYPCDEMVALPRSSLKLLGCGALVSMGIC